MARQAKKTIANHILGEQAALQIQPAVSSEIPQNMQEILGRVTATKLDEIEAYRIGIQRQAQWFRAFNAWADLPSWHLECVRNHIPPDEAQQPYLLKLIELGRILEETGWRSRLDELPAGSDDKQAAVHILRTAIDGNVEMLTRIVAEFQRSELKPFALSVERWLQTGLRDELFNIKYPPIPPVGWEGSYDIDVTTVERFIEWIDLFSLVENHVNEKRTKEPTSGVLLRNAYRLADKLNLVEIPEQPLGTFTFWEEWSMLMNLRRACIRLLPKQQPVNPPQTESFRTPAAEQQTSVSPIISEPASAPRRFLTKEDILATPDETDPEKIADGKRRDAELFEEFELNNKSIDLPPSAVDWEELTRIRGDDSREQLKGIVTEALQAALEKFPAAPDNPEKDSEPDGQQKKLSPSREKAYSQYQGAVARNAELDGASDQTVYDWLSENADDGEEFPSFDNWSRYLREARKAFGTNKNSSRTGRKTGGGGAYPKRGDVGREY